MDKIVAKFLTLKVHSWRGNYTRWFCVTKAGITNIDPASWTVTNEWPYADVVELSPLPGDGSEFNFVVRNGRKTQAMKFRCDNRSELLCAAAHWHNTVTNLAPSQRVPAVKVTRNDTRAECFLEAGVAALNQFGPEMQPLSSFPYHLLDGVRTTADDSTGLIVLYRGKGRLFLVPDRGALLARLAERAGAVGVSVPVDASGPTTVNAAKTARLEFGPAAGEEELQTFSVKKFSHRYAAPVPRRLVVTRDHLVLRDAATYAVVTCDPLDSVAALVRHEDDGQRLTVELAGGQRVSVLCGRRDALLAALLDAVGRGAPRLAVPVDAAAAPRGLRLRYTADASAQGVEEAHVKHLTAALKAAAGALTATAATPVPRSESDGPLPRYPAEAVAACAEFNANVPCGRGLHPGIRSKAVLPLLPPLARLLVALGAHAVARREPPAIHACTALAALYRLLATPGVAAAALAAEDMRHALGLLLRAPHQGIAFWAAAVLTATSLPPDPPLEVLQGMAGSRRRGAGARYERDQAAELATKRALLRVPGVSSSLRALLRESRADDHGAHVLLHVVQFCEGAVCTYRDSTDAETRAALLRLLGAEPAAVLRLFRSPCPSVVEAAALVMKVLVEEGGAAKRAEVQTAALAEGVALRHLGRALFSPSPDNRYISAYLVSLWAGGSAPALSLLRRVFPAGLAAYLDMPRLSAPELQALAAAAGARRPGRARPSRLRRRLDMATGGYATADTAENFPVFFHMCTQNHQRAELVWNAETRAELKRSLETELRDLEREKQHAAKGVRVSWNYREFEVEYKSLEKEVRIGDHFLRLMLEEQDRRENERRERTGSVAAAATGDDAGDAGDASALEVRDPTTFFNSLYMRMLRERDPALRVYCVRALAMVYERYWRDIGPFPDTAYVVTLIRDSTDRKFRDRASLLLAALARHPANAQVLLHPDRVVVLVDLATLVHADTDHAGARGTSLLSKQVRPHALLLTAGDGARPDGTDAAGGQGTSGPAGASAAPAPAPAPGSGDGSAGAVGAREWHWQDRSGKTHGPVSVGELKGLLGEKKVDANTHCWASHMGEWRPMKQVPQLRWRLLCRGGSGLAPAEVTLVCLRLLRRLAAMHPSVDETGAVIRPVPRAKRLLLSQRALPAIVQLLLTEEPRVVEAAVALLSVLMENNDGAMAKLYTTGFFVFALGYTGSNFKSIAGLFYQTHLKQHFRTHADALAEDVPVAKRSILGHLLPESLLCVLENYGPEKFAETFLGNFDNPEVIWKYGMRKFVVEMVAQHLGDLRSRLSDNTQAVYDFCPMPGVVYEDLKDELWCHNFYLANLCDEHRFPEWPIRKPVELLRAVLDAWRLERQKEGPGVSVAEALALLGVEDGASANAVRRAYRKLAMKYHPDKNPEGREMFEQIQRAYEILSNARNQVTGPDPVNVLLIVRTQRILFKRFAPTLKPYKYAGYPYLLETLTVRAEEPLDEARLRLLEAAAELVFFTCLCSPLNAEELVREEGVQVLADLVHRCFNVISPVTPADAAAVVVVRHVLHTFAGLGAFKSARAKMLESPTLFRSLSLCVAMHQAPWVVKYALETMGRLAVDTRHQNELVRAGALWTLPPLLFRFDPSMEGTAGGDAGDGKGGGADAAAEQAEVEAAGADAAEAARTRDSHVQHAANVNARLAARVLGRLGGYMEGKLKTPRNAGVQLALTYLLTKHVAAMLRLATATELLRVLNTSAQTPLLLWTPGMRAQLQRFLEQQLARVRDGEPGCAGPEAALRFRYAALEREPVVGDVYLRLYNEQAPVQLDRVEAFAAALCDCVAFEVGWGPGMHPGFAGSRDAHGKREASRAAAAAALTAPAGKPGATDDFDLLAGPPTASAPASAADADDLFAGLPRAGTPAQPKSAAADSADVDLLGLGGFSPAAASPAAPAPAPADPFADLMGEGSGNAGGAAGGSGAGSGAGAGSPGGGAETAAQRRARRRSGVTLDGRDAIAVPAGDGKQPGDNPVAGCGGAGCAVYARGKLSATLPDCVVQCLVALLHALHAQQGAQAAVCAGRGLPLLFWLLERGVGDARRLPAARCVRELVRDTASAAAAAAGGLGVCLLGVLRKRQADAAELALESVEAMANARNAVAHLEEMGAVVDMLALVCERRRPLYEGCRERAAAVLGKLCAEPMHGPKITLRLQRFMPVALAAAFREEGGGALTAFDASHESPDLIWGDDMRDELQTAVAGVAGEVQRTLASGSAWTLDDGFRVTYRALASELVVAGVYVRLYLKEPTFPLRDPRAFMEESMRLFETKSMAQLRAAENRDKGALTTIGGGGVDDSGLGFTLGTVTATVDDAKLVPILTSAAVCVLKVRPSLADHFAHLGHPAKVVAIAKRAMDLRAGVASSALATAAADTFAGLEASLGRSGMGAGAGAGAGAAGTGDASTGDVAAAAGMVATSCVRLLHAIGTNRKCVEKIAATPVAETVMRTLKPVHADAAFTLDALRRLLTTAAAHGGGGGATALSATPGDGSEPDAAASAAAASGTRAIVAAAINGGVVDFLVGLLEGDTLDRVKDMSAAKVHVVETLKFLAADRLFGVQVTAMLDRHEVWEQYKHQKHDLFVSKNQKTDYFLEDSTEVLAIKDAPSAPRAAAGPPPSRPMPRQAPPSLFD